MQTTRIYIEAKERIKAAGITATANAITVLLILSQSRRLHSIEQIILEIKNNEAYENVSTVFTTIYRCLLRMEKAGLLRSIQLSDGSSRYEETTLTPKPQIQHVICEQCSTVESFEYVLPKEIEAHIQKTLGYEKTSSFLELRGICKVCQSNKTRS